MFCLFTCSNNEYTNPTTPDAKFFATKDAAIDAMVKDFSKVDSILGYTNMAEDDDHELSRSEMGIFVRDGMDTARWEVIEVKPANAAYALISGENSDNGDPCTMAAIRFFLDYTGACIAMDEAAANTQVQVGGDIQRGYADQRFLSVGDDSWSWSIRRIPTPVIQAEAMMNAPIRTLIRGSHVRICDVTPKKGPAVSFIWDNRDMSDNDARFWMGEMIAGKDVENIASIPTPTCKQVLRSVAEPEPQDDLKKTLFTACRRLLAKYERTQDETDRLAFSAVYSVIEEAKLEQTYQVWKGENPYRSVEELTRDELTVLKQQLLTERLDKKGEQPSYGELADADETISDEEVMEAYAGVEFGPEDLML